MGRSTRIGVFPRRTEKPPCSGNVDLSLHAHPLRARPRHAGRARRRLVSLLLVVAVFAANSSFATAGPLDDAKLLFRQGKYEECLTTTTKAIEDGQWSDSWRILKAECELELGRYDAAKLTLETALKRYTTNLKLRWLSYITLRLHGEDEAATQKLAELEALARDRPWRYTDTESRVVLGTHFLHRKADPRQVLDLFYDKAKKDDPKSPDAYIASGDLALDKSDYQLAAEEFRRAIKLDVSRAEAHFGLARALAESDGEAAEISMREALRLNPNYVPAFIILAERHIDAERYEEARKAIGEALRVNPHQPDAWALKAVLAHLDADYEREKKHRARALKYWAKNPEVDHRIGRKLSRKYRFAEGAAYQRAALKLDADYLPAALQLSQDLLRLGDEEEGWRLAAEVNAKDGYSVLAHNLVSLHDEIQKFRSLEFDGFVVRMERREAEIYGNQVRALLSEARDELVSKYQVDLDEPTVVEIFPRQADFAIRTFGLPGGAGFLGVCFGRVITANSPASMIETPTNWRSVLWHEYCHVVTLQKTSNKMPRWLSEGISVYEERLRDPSWGQVMSPQYREMILGGELTPVSELSGAFLSPPSGAHLQFAYYESSLVVEFIVEKYGFATLLRILDDLNVGMPINDSLSRYAGGVKALDTEFANWAKDRAEKLAEKVDFEKPQDSITDPAVLLAWNAQHPNSYWGLTSLASALIEAKRWEEARPPLEKLRELFPGDRSSTSAARLLAQVHRELADADSEKAVLQAWCDLSSDDLDAFLRMTELMVNEERWDDARRYIAKAMAVNPLRPDLQRQRAGVAEKTGDNPEAIEALQSILALDPLDPADAHYRLAVALDRHGDIPAAKRQVLQALEEAPRYLDAHRLLRRLNAKQQQPGSSKKPPGTQPMTANPATANPPPGNPATGNPATGNPAPGNPAPGNPPPGNKSKPTDDSPPNPNERVGEKPLRNDAAEPPPANPSDSGVKAKETDTTDTDAKAADPRKASR